MISEKINVDFLKSAELILLTPVVLKLAEGKDSYRYEALLKELMEVRATWGTKPVSELPVPSF